MCTSRGTGDFIRVATNQQWQVGLMVNLDLSGMQISLR